MLTWPELRRILARHDLRRRNAAASPWEGLVLGNGGMGAVVFGDPTAYTWRLNRTDLMDARRPDEDVPLYTLREMLRIGNERSRELPPGARIPDFDRLPFDGATVPYPCARTGADFLLRISPPIYHIPLMQRLALSEATLHTSTRVGLWGKAPLHVTSRVLHHRDALAVRVSGIANHNHGFLAAALRRDPWGGRTRDNLAHGEWGVRGWRDPAAGALPLARVSVDGSTALLLQEFPGGPGAEAYWLAVAAVQAEGLPFAMEGDDTALCCLRALGDVPETVTFYTATATHADADAAAAQARAIADGCRADGWAALERDHRRAWRGYWLESAVELADRRLEKQWYRANYLLAANARSGAPAPGLFGVSLPYDCPPWRGDRHNNYPEAASVFWGSYVANHLDRALCYTETIERLVPQGRQIARDIFECDGIAFGHITFERMTEPYMDNLWSRTLYVTAAYVQNLWWHYRFSGDRAYLRRVYPILAACADFYASLVAKNPPGDYTLWPTVPTEYRGFVADFALNKNMVEDLAMVKSVLQAAIDAAGLLGEASPARWTAFRAHFPDYSTVTVDGITLFADVEGATEMPPYNHSLALAPFFPGEDPEVYGRWRQAAENTLDGHPWGDSVRRAIACARLGRTADALAAIHGDVAGNTYANFGSAATEDDNNCTYASACSVIRPIAELLLQSHDGVIRVFPAWPKGKRARFRDLRAAGGFRLSAHTDGHQIGPILLASDAGNPATVQLPWPTATVTTQDMPVQATVGEGKVTFETMAGRSYHITPG
jgi:hypothetical protein